MPRRGYYTTYRYPRKRVERRIVMPQPVKRPIRFQIRSIIRHKLIQPDPWWFTMHRRGPVRPKVGEDPLEARAVPKTVIRGTLPERILYRYLISVMAFVPGIDFDFQSSLQGGRIEVGGIVADFLFEFLRIVIQVQGPTHDQYLRVRKDEEQRLALNELGYEVFELDVPTIYNESRLEEAMRRIFNWLHSGSAGLSYNEAYYANLEDGGIQLEALKSQAMNVYASLESMT